MKKRQMRLAACLLAGALLITGANVAPAFAAQTRESVNIQVTGVPLALANVESQTGDSLQAEAEEAVKEQEEAAQNEAEYYASLGVAQVDNYVNVRSAATTDSDVVGRMENGAVATIVGEEDGWYQITSGSISGYVQMDYLVVGNKELVDSVKMSLAVIQADALKVRAEASTDATVLMQVKNGESLEVVDTDTEGWVKVSTSQGEGYVSAEYVQLTESYLYAKEPQDICSGEAVAEYGLRFVGNRYVYGGTSLTNGTDCSGFVMSVYAHYGVSLPHSSSALRSVGTEVSYSEAQPGDIICYSGHVGIYIGNGQIVHAANERKGITVSTATFANIITVRRIFQ